MPSTPDTGSQPAHPLWLGCNALSHIDQAVAARLISAALDHGVTRFDTADVYAGGESEADLGRLLPADRSSVESSRSSGIQTVHWMASRHARPSIWFVPLRQVWLRCDRIDIYMIHFPEPSTPYRETLEALEAARMAGKIGS